jgi:RNA polymerase sigma-70 factor (ECF subfamily)
MDLVKKQHDVTQWVNDYSDALFGYAVQRVGDRQGAADLVQETFLAAWRNVDGYNGEASVKTWLFTILKNKIIDHYRKAATRQAKFVKNDSNPFFDEADHWKDGLCPQDWGDHPETRMNTKEFYAAFDNCKGKLKEIYSAVFTMKYLEDLQSEEICKVLNITTSNYWVIIHRA